MTGPQHTFHIPELADQWIGLLQNSRSDLVSCALVCRSWVYPAQARLLEEVLLEGPRRYSRQWTQLLHALQSSPHLVRHVRRLHLDTNLLQRGQFSRICAFPFTNLVGLDLPLLQFHDYASLAVQTLLRVSTPRFLNISTCFIPKPATFIGMWDGCCPTLRSVSITGFDRSIRESQLVRHDRTTPAARLLSLRIGISSGIVPRWLLGENSPFDLTGLKVLSVNVAALIPQWRMFAPTFRELVAFEFTITAFDEVIDLSLFHNLTSLRACYGPGCWINAWETFTTILTSNCLRQVLICGPYDDFDDEYCLRLDSILSRRLVDPSCTVGVLIDGRQLDHAVVFPRLHSRDMIYEYSRPDWFGVWIRRRTSYLPLTQANRNKVEYCDLRA
ncbi:hypothetical protein DFH07DRAFT_1065697 [Mycena maculata]|uniref:F-box domain-containing protein n=1 Tax=Mycena maculata TaxID=230809 RepID=A0AAD7I0P4_9AGAR|nr:hypothetical protein DFH07DRAFT_1065697 [Mycena maculata]